MPETQSQPAVTQPRFRLSLDLWAVVLALAAALLVRFDLIRNVKW